MQMCRWLLLLIVQLTLRLEESSEIFVGCHLLRRRTDGNFRWYKFKRSLDPVKYLSLTFPAALTLSAPGVFFVASPESFTDSLAKIHSFFHVVDDVVADTTLPVSLQTLIGFPSGKARMVILDRSKVRTKASSLHNTWRSMNWICLLVDSVSSIFFQIVPLISVSGRSNSTN